MSRNATTVLASSTLVVCLLFALPLSAARIAPVGVSEPVEI